MKVHLLKEDGTILKEIEDVYPVCGDMCKDCLNCVRCIREGDDDLELSEHIMLVPHHMIVIFKEQHPEIEL